ncbi:hypothetical protein VNI00_008563 [Paramarasmius palmivorus]|uniref:Diacetyl reductase [(S)-acetoin forming] n=1 Tax=Paramarasmius palmivorus TaxID=297713 RepID=A0AAW0CVP0_9AGAR
MQRLACLSKYLHHCYTPIRNRKFATSPSVTNRTALITGAGRGIGRAIALRLASDGFDICVNDLERNAENAEAVAKEVNSLGRSSVVTLGDVTKMPEVENMIQTSVKTLGPLNVVVANAGIVQVKLLSETTESDMRQVFETNVFGLMNTGIAAARQLIEQGEGGKIINAASIASFRPSQFLSTYSATKAAVRSLTQSFAVEYAKHKITVNGYAPGVVGTDMWEKIDAEMSRYSGFDKGQHFRATEQLIALGRTSVPEDVSNLVSFLASPDSDYITGTCFSFHS